MNGKYIYIYKNNKFIVANCEEVIDNIIKGYEYLMNMNKEDLQISYFIKQLYTSIINTIHKKYEYIYNICI